MRRTTGVLIVAMALASSPSWGQAAEPAREQYDRGVRQYDVAHYSDAEIAFKHAHELSRDEPSYLFALAQAQRRLGEASTSAGERTLHFTHAIDSFKKYRTQGRGTRSEDASVWIAKLEEVIAVGSKGQQSDDESLIVVMAEPIDARIAVDGKFVGQGQQIRAKRGLHTFRAERNGFIAREETRECMHASEFVKLDLDSLPTRMMVTGTPNTVGAKVWVDQKYVGDIQRAPLVVSIAPGVSNVFVSKRGAEPLQGVAEVGRGETYEFPVRLSRSSTRVAAYGLAASAGVSLLFGVVSVGLALSAEGDVKAYDADTTANRTDAQRDQRDQRYYDRNTWRAAAITSFGLSAGMLAVGAALYWFDVPTLPLTPVRERKFAGPVKVVPTGTGLVVHGSF